MYADRRESGCPDEQPDAALVAAVHGRPARRKRQGVVQTGTWGHGSLLVRTRARACCDRNQEVRRVWTRAHPSDFAGFTCGIEPCDRRARSGRPPSAVHRPPSAVGRSRCRTCRHRPSAVQPLSRVPPCPRCKPPWLISSITPGSFPRLPSTCRRRSPTTNATRVRQSAGCWAGCVVPLSRLGEVADRSPRSPARNGTGRSLSSCRAADLLDSRRGDDRPVPRLIGNGGRDHPRARGGAARP